MKRLGNYIFVLLVGVMLLGFTACSSFDGNYKEASVAEIQAINSEISAAIDKDGFGVLYKKDGDGMTSASKLETVTKKDGTETKMVVESSSHMKNVNKTLQSAGKIKIELKGEKHNIESYVNKDGAYMAFDDTKVMVGDGKNISSNSEFVPRALDMLFDDFLDWFDEILKHNAKELVEAGVEVGIDRSDMLLTKVKYIFTKEVVNELIEKEIELKECRITVILDQYKRLYGIKETIDMTVKDGEDSCKFKGSGEIIKSDKDVKFPALNMYKYADETSKTILKAKLSDVMKEINKIGTILKLSD